jgi:DNA-binding NtrC family response regulator
LDEVGELPLAAQVALLRVLEAKKITPVGGSDEIAVDVRIIAATHRDLKEQSQSGKFREDLFYRLNGMTLRVPPLREHAEDVQPLAERFLREANLANRCTVPAIENRALHLLIAYHWPGNIRELRNVIERAVVLAGDRAIDTQDLPEAFNPLANMDTLEQTGEFDFSEEDEFLRKSEGGVSAEKGIQPIVPVTTQPFTGSKDDENLDFKTRMRNQMESHEAELIRKALEETRWNQSAAAKLLKIPIRTLSRKIKQYDIK